MNLDMNYFLKSLILMKEKIDLFKNKKINLVNVTLELTALLNLIATDAEREWFGRAQTEINTLEYLVDSFNDNSISRWIETPEKTINECINNLHHLIKEKIDFYKLNIVDRAEKIDTDILMCPRCSEVWQQNSNDGLVICPSCACLLQNPMDMIEIREENVKIKPSKECLGDEYL